jgi:hypothetical protein
LNAILIDPVKQVIETIYISSLVDIAEYVGQDTLDSEGRFQIDKLIPLAGKGVVIGTTDDGDSLRDVEMDAEDLRNRIKYL